MAGPGRAAVPPRAQVVHIPWYATGFRGDQLQRELERISAISLRYGASSYSVYRSRADRYKLLQAVAFAHKSDWERYWDGPEFTDFRIVCQGWFQVPIVYDWTDLVCEGYAPAQNGSAVEQPV